ncbi:hypothetical protein HCN51_17015 [Nonomuraea sp. FMUSA5-5]|uniref:Uncharacterized protein n=1 Tax=Nonomuraea composti TaxID=2720023 RepID=A0ABX1AZV3_9ACTN|nr:hypothetical protein [Nonomuraea sp. FMUSA5-5]NJP91134.1 hypothetical protein [Nonomuraea sp. FMUSA5-5]
MAAMFVIYGFALVWVVPPLLTLARRQVRVLVLGGHIVTSGLLAWWLISTRWDEGMVVIMMGPGVLVSLGRLAVLLWRRVPERRSLRS